MIFSKIMVLSMHRVKRIIFSNAFSMSNSNNACAPLHVFTSMESLKVEVYKECTQGVCACKYEK